MKSTVVPAQITTVEDKIAGSLSFSQIMLLVFSLIIGTTLYGLISPRLHLSTLKVILIMGQFLGFGTLALRYRGRILAEWLALYLKFQTRPRIYIFSKNDLYGRDIYQKKELEEEPVAKPVKMLKKVAKAASPIISSTASVVSVKPSKKGGFDVEYMEAS